MNTYRSIFVLTVMLLSLVGYTQVTPEQRKQMEEAQEAQKKAMEMMKNNPEMKKIMEQMQMMEAQKAMDREKRQEETRENAAEQHKDHMQEYYWRNKVASDNNGVFADWQWGEVQLGIYTGDGKMGPDGTPADKSYLIVGRISNEGNVSIDLPSNVKTNRVLSNGLFPQMFEINLNDMNFSNPQTALLYTGFTISVLKGDTPIGRLYIGNSERTTHNLASPSMLKYGDEGYMLYWAYIAEASTATYRREDRNVEINEGEEVKMVDRRYLDCDLKFTPGWNLVQIKVDGFHKIGNSTRWKNKYYRVISQMPADARYYFRYEDQ